MQIQHLEEIEADDMSRAMVCKYRAKKEQASVDERAVSRKVAILIPESVLNKVKFQMKGNGRSGRDYKQRRRGV